MRREGSKGDVCIKKRNSIHELLMGDEERREEQGVHTLLRKKTAVRKRSQECTCMTA